MFALTRREFSASLSAFVLLPSDRLEPELILHNGNLLTMEARQPRARALAIAGGRLLAVGSDDDVLPLAGGRTRKMDLGGKTVVPGFIDSHSHPASAGLSHLRNVDCDLRSIGEIQQSLRERARRTPKGEWVLGFKYDDTKTAERRFLRLSDLDAVSTAHPIFVRHRGGHTAYVNTAAMKLAGVDRNTPDPPGGHFHRDPDTGELSGRIEERATDAFTRHMRSEVTREDRRQGVKDISQRMARAGLTSVHDAYGSPDDLRAYQEARDAGELLTRVYCLIGSQHFDRMHAAGVRTSLGDEWVRVGAMKMTCDGSISERTARLSEPYVGRPDYHGLWVTSEEELYEKARRAHEAGWQNGIHANGDVAIEMVLGIYERIQRELPRRDPRFRIEHCTVVNEGIVRRIRALGVIPNPFATYVYFHGEKMVEYGAARTERMFAVRSFLDAGVRVTMNSDYPPGPFEPMMALQSMVTRTDWEGKVWGANQRVSVEEALRVGTLHGAYASFEERHKGSLTAGKLADLVVLGRDPLRSEPSELINIPIERTMVGGKWVYEA